MRRIRSLGRSRRPLLSLATLVALVALAGVACRSGPDESGGEATGSGEGSGPVASVRVAPLEERAITEDLLVYGVVVAGPGARFTISASYESRVEEILVSESQLVDSSTVVVRLAASPEATLALGQARQEADMLEQRLHDVEDRQRLELATNDEVLQARQDSEDARLRYRSLRSRTEGAESIAAAGPGVVTHIYVTQGQLVPPGDPIVDIDLRVDREVRLGIEPEDVARVTPGQTVACRRPGVPMAAELTGTLRSIAESVDPDTRLVTAYATLPEDSGTLVNEYLEATIAIESGPTLVAPREAAQPRDDHYVLFTVTDGRAVAHDVAIGMQNATEVEVLGAADLSGGDLVVVVGNAVLEDGMAVHIETAP